MNLRILSGILLVFIVLTACQVTSELTISNTPDRGSTDYQFIFNTPADPASAAVALDGSRAVEAVIPVEGGTLSATGADGTQYVLEIPGDALLVETAVRLIPAAVSSLPFGSEQTYAAQLEPEGLFFNNYVTLTIRPPQEIPLAEQIFFGYQEAGKDVTFAPPVVDTQELKILLLHFSGYGVTKGLLADPESVREHLGGSAERRLQSLAGQILTAERVRQLLGGEDSGANLLDAGLQELMDRYEQEVIEPRIAAAGTSCAAGRLAIQTVLGHERQKQLLGASDGSGMDKVAGLMETVGRVCLKEEYELCEEDHIIHRMVPVWLGFERQAQLLGASEASTNSELSKYALDLVKKCLTFELQFVSSATFDDGYGDGYDSSVKAKIPLHFDPQEMTIKGETALVNEAFEFKVDGCSVTSNRGGSSILVSSLAYITGTKSPTDELGYVRDFKLSYFPETTTESFTVKCPDSPSYSSPPMGLWSGIYLVLHSDELNPDAVGGDGGSSAPPMPEMPDLGSMMEAAEFGFMLPSFTMPEGTSGGGFILEDWEVTGGDFFASKEWIKEDGSLGLDEEGTFKLYHRPGR